MPEKQIAHYRITAKLGQGGMGEVFQATDTKLNREVAIKVLPDSFARDKERLARFQREADVLTSLNHPGIAGIYGLEETEGSKALVLELVEGGTLSERLKRARCRWKRFWKLGSRSLKRWRLLTRKGLSTGT